MPGVVRWEWDLKRAGQCADFALLLTGLPYKHVLVAEQAYRDWMRQENTRPWRCPHWSGPQYLNEH